MRGVRSAAAVAADQQFVAGGQAFRNQASGLVDRFFERRQGPRSRDTILDSLLQKCHGSKFNARAFKRKPSSSSSELRDFNKPQERENGVDVVRFSSPNQGRSSGPLLDLFDRPPRVFGDKRFRIG